MVEVGTSGIPWFWVGITCFNMLTKLFNHFHLPIILLQFCKISRFSGFQLLTATAGFSIYKKYKLFMPRFKILKKFIFRPILHCLPIASKFSRPNSNRWGLLSNLSARQFVAEVIRDWGITRINPTPQAKILLLLGLPCSIFKDCLMLQGFGLMMV